MFSASRLKRERANPRLRIEGIDSAVAITAGRYASCALLSDGSIRCWGDFGESTAGQNETTTPITIEGTAGKICL